MPDPAPPTAAKAAELEKLVRSLQDAMHNKLGELERRLSEVEQQLPRKAVEKDVPVPELKPTLRELAEDQVVEYEVAGTVWNVAALMGLPGVSWGTSVLLCLNLLVNVTVQLYICYVLLTGHRFIQTRSFQEVLPAMRHWRSSVGHEMLQADNRGTSLVSRLCADDKSLSVANFQTQLLAEINDYLGLDLADVDQTRLGEGPMLCFCCLFLFTVMVLKEFQQVIFCLRAFARPPRGKDTHLDLETGSFVALSQVRFVGIAVVITVRAGVAVILLWTGGMWLSSTSSTTDLVLNAAALCFIMDLDEYLWQTTVPISVRALAQRLQPMRFKRPWWNLEAVLPLCAATLFTMFLMHTQVAVNTADMLKVKQALCGGEQDFILTQNPAGIMVSRPSTPYSPESADDSVPFRAAAELIHRSGDAVVGLSLWRSDNEEFLMEALADIATYAAEMPCEDLDSYGGGAVIMAMPGLAYAAWSGVVGDQRTNYSCAELAGSCQTQSLVRLVCSVTCGCDHPSSGLFLIKSKKGCPESCEAISQARLQSSPCVDSAGGNWSRYWEGFRSFLEFHPVTNGLETLADDALAQGCELGSFLFLGTADFCDEEHELLQRYGIGSVMSFCPAKCCRTAGQPPAQCPAACSAP